MSAEHHCQVRLILTFYGQITVVKVRFMFVCKLSFYEVGHCVKGYWSCCCVFDCSIIDLLMVSTSSCCWW